MEIDQIFTPQVIAAIRIFAIIIAVIHILVALVLYNFIRNVSRQVQTPSEGSFKFIGIVHICLLVVILLAIVILF